MSATHRVHLAFRVGGRALAGDYPWFDAASVGGNNNRGYRSRRFTGDSSLFGSVSLRGWLGTVGKSFIALRVGALAFTDVGRVWVEGEDSNDLAPDIRRRAAPATGGRADHPARHRGARQGRHAPHRRVRLPVLSSSTVGPEET